MAAAKRHASLPPAYLERELAYVKHELLKAYLEKLFLIIGMSSSRLGIKEICYVDCFAGPWQAKNESLSDTSIGVSLRILDKCQKELKARGVDLTFRALYIEQDNSAFAHLATFLSDHTPSGIEAHSIHGDFVVLRDQILTWCGQKSFVFFFIDPTGWKEVSIGVLKPLLQRRQSEFLINFMYDFVNRTASIPGWEADIAALLGKAVAIGNLDPGQREKLLLDTYRENLKRELPPSTTPRSAYVRVLDREKQRPKYHLVYLTTHPRGIVEFMEISEEIDLVQKRVRASARQATRAKKYGMDDMFDDLPVEDSDADRADTKDIEKYWLQRLSQGTRRVGVEDFANMLEETDWFPGDFQLVLKQLIEAGKVRNLDAIRARRKKPLHWEKDGERLELTEVTK